MVRQAGFPSLRVGHTSDGNEGEGENGRRKKRKWTEGEVEEGEKKLKEGAPGNEEAMTGSLLTRSGSVRHQRPVFSYILVAFCSRRTDRDMSTPAAPLKVL